MSDETQAGIAPADETVVVAPIVDYPETPAAWSLDETEVVEVRSWASTWGHAAAIAGICVAVAFAICVIGVAIVIASSGRGRPVPIHLPPMPTSSLPVPPTPAALPPISSEPIAQAPEDDEWVATAVSQTAITRFVRAGAPDRYDGYLGGSFAAPTQRGAKKGAMDGCAKVTGNTDCVLVNNGVRHGCIAYRIDLTVGSYTVGTGSTDRAAREAADRALGSADGRGDSDCSTHAGEG